MGISRRRDRFVDHTAWHQDKVTSIRLRRLHNHQIAAVCVQTNQQIESFCHRRLERPIESWYQLFATNTNPLTRLEVLEFRGQRLVFRVNNRRIPSAFPKQIGQKTLAASNIGNPARIESSNQVTVQELKTKPLQFRQLVTGLPPRINYFQPQIAQRRRGWIFMVSVLMIALRMRHEFLSIVCCAQYDQVTVSLLTLTFQNVSISQYSCEYTQLLFSDTQKFIDVPEHIFTPSSFLKSGPHNHLFIVTSIHQPAPFPLLRWNISPACIPFFSMFPQIALPF